MPTTQITHTLQSSLLITNVSQNSRKLCPCIMKANIKWYSEKQYLFVVLRNTAIILNAVFLAVLLYAILEEYINQQQKQTR